MKPDRDIDPPDQYNRIKSTFEDVTQAYRVGMGLPPLRIKCPDCWEVYDKGEEHECPKTLPL